jgi:CPA1 family monovalent cation:H+ antiporter
MTSSADLIAILLFLAAVVAVLNHRTIRLPRAIALLLGSLAFAGLLAGIDPYVTADLSGWMRGMLSAAALPDVLLDSVLGVLLFAASLHVDLTELRRQGWTVLVLATAGVIISTVAFGGGIWALFGAAGSPIPLGWCMALGALLAPTDAVVVDTLLMRAPLPAALKAAISGESLFNDGAGVVLFQITLAMALGEHGLVGHGRVALAFAIAGIGGGALGCVTGFLAARAMRWANEAGLRLIISLALVTCTYRLAALIEVSGPIAVVTCGFVLRMQSPRTAEGSVLDDISGFWNVTNELLNAMLFVLIGFELFVVDLHLVVLAPVIAALPLAVLSRGVGVVIPMLLLRGSSPQQRRGMAVLTWAGLRGGVSIALALTLPASAYRGRLIVVCYAVVVFSTLVQGLTMPRVLKRLYPEP